MKLMYRVTTLVLLVFANMVATADDTLKSYVATVEQKGIAPNAFVVDKLRQHDVLLFDDANHQAKEPFDFYIQLVRDPDFQALQPTLYIELFAVSEQPHIDAFLAAPEKDLSLLYPVFQATYTPYGFPMKSYFDLLDAVYDVNQGLPAAERLRVVAVSNPALWPLIETPADYAAAQKTLAGRDHAMYRAILDDMAGLSAGKKGVFLTNTRHAYTGIRKQDGAFFWNTGTFFRQWHPGKSFSIRIHAPQLFIEAVMQGGDARDQEGLSRKKYYWSRMEDGLWDSAFAGAGDRPVAVDLAGTPFGRADYVGNHMLDAAPGQTMADAYDGLIFLQPIDTFTATAKVADFYTAAFVEEVVRRLRIYRTEAEQAAMMERAGVDSLTELVLARARPAPTRPLLPQGTLGAMDAWQQREQ